MKCTIKWTCWRLLSQQLGSAWSVSATQLLLPSLSAHLIQESRTAHQTRGCGINPALVQPTQHLEELLIQDTVTENNYTLKKGGYKNLKSENQGNYTGISIIYNENFTTYIENWWWPCFFGNGPFLRGAILRKSVNFLFQITLKMLRILNYYYMLLSYILDNKFTHK